MCFKFLTSLRFVLDTLNGSIFFNQGCYSALLQSYTVHNLTKSSQLIICDFVKEKDNYINKTASITKSMKHLKQINTINRLHRESLLGKSSCFFSHLLYETPIVEASPSHIRMEIFQGIGNICAFPILEKSISNHPLGINILNTICSPMENVRSALPKTITQT